jgi:threonine dehydratase
MTVTIDDIEAACRRLAPVLKPTPLQRSATLSRMLEAEVLIKPENLQKTGSFKIRGACNRVMALTPEQARRGVVAASAGNHGQALAYAATAAGVKATIVMPETAAIAKVEATRGYGQKVALRGANYQESRCAADYICRESGGTFVDAYDDPWVIAGQGTVGLEIADEHADFVVVPVGGGGLIAGVTVALAAHSPNTKIIGAEPSARRN